MPTACRPSQRPGPRHPDREPTPSPSRQTAVDLQGHWNRSAGSGGGVPLLARHLERRPYMLVLTRRLNQTILFPGTGIGVRVVAAKANWVRLGIDAPAQVTVLRGELLDSADPPPLPSREGEFGFLLGKRLEIAGAGLALLRRQLEGGQADDDALLTLAGVEQELRLLGERVRGRAVGGAGGGPEAPAPKRKALLVEDNAQERELMARCLRGEGLEGDTAGDGLAALDYLRDRGRPDVVFLDMGLPRLDGAAAVREIRRDPSFAGLKIFAVSGCQREECNVGLGPEGVDRWFQKPVDPSELLRD